jgi:3-hydroxyacyl-CoA dehydrogenase/enoyl-CoA hydratase/3-hydroxybutyryl-CoA epimerase
VSTAALTVRIDRGVGWLELDVPGEAVNTISPELRSDLAEALESLARDGDVRAVVLVSRKPGSFIAGADINAFVALRGRDEAHALVRAGQAAINRVESLGKPVVAAIHGNCLGGGLELALACTYRIATDDPATRIGLPEVQLGIIPAAGGCQRLPRLIGLQPALDIILAGKTVAASRARRLGIVDELVHPCILDQVAEQAAGRLADGWTPGRSRLSVRRLATDRNPLGRRMLFTAARKQLLKKTGGHYPAPVAALQAVEHGMTHGVEAGLDIEATLFAELAIGGVSRNLVRLFFATTALKKDPGVQGDVPPPRPIAGIGVMGAGFMGAAIGGIAVLRAGTDVRFRDRDLRSVGGGLRVARTLLDEQLERRRITTHAHRRLLSLLSGTDGWDGFGLTDLVIEAVYEDRDLKRQIFREVEAHVRDDCVLASNTSTIPISQIADAVARPERVLGMHFFSPVAKMPLLEVIVAERTAPWATATAVRYGRELGKTVIVVRDRPGFWVNRILAPYLNEAGRLLAEGVPVEVIDRAMMRFGFPVGPVTLLDEVGLDVAHKGSEVLHEAFGARLQPTEGLVRMLDDGRLGRKNARGFYRYDDGKRREVDLAAYEIIGAGADPDVSKEDVQARLVFAMLNEAVLALDEGVVRSARDGDVGAVFGIGFPAFRGGPLRYLDELGLADAVDVLRDLQRTYGDRFAPAPRLVAMAGAGETFHPSS